MLFDPDRHSVEYCGPSPYYHRHQVNQIWYDVALPTYQCVHCGELIEWTDDHDGFELLRFRISEEP